MITTSRPAGGVQPAPAAQDCEHLFGGLDRFWEPELWTPPPATPVLLDNTVADEWREHLRSGTLSGRQHKSVVTSQRHIRGVHAHVGNALERCGADASSIFGLDRTGGEYCVPGVNHNKNIDVVAAVGDDLNSAIFVPVKSGGRGIDKNRGNNLDSLDADCSNIHGRYPYATVGTLYVVNAYDHAERTKRKGQRTGDPLGLVNLTELINRTFRSQGRPARFDDLPRSVPCPDLACEAATLIIHDNRPDRPTGTPAYVEDAAHLRALGVDDPLVHARLRYMRPEYFIPRLVAVHRLRHPGSPLFL